MSSPLDLPGLAELRRRTNGEPEVIVAVLDGPVDRDHGAFAHTRFVDPRNAEMPLSRPQDFTSAHGTIVASILFGDGSGIDGIAPGVTAMPIALFDRDRQRVPQLAIARAITDAVDAGAHIINLSAGQYTDVGEADDWLTNAVKLCEARGVLLVAAAGNDGCDCLHVPAALSTVLAVGALDSEGHPKEFSNWGPAYAHNGILAPGEDILGALPGGGLTRSSGTSIAAPIVSGIAALLVSLQLLDGKSADPLAVRDALLAGAIPCSLPNPESCRRMLGGIINIQGARKVMTANETEAHLSACDCGTPQSSASTPSIPEFAHAIIEADSAPPEAVRPAVASLSPNAPVVEIGAALSATDDPGVSLVYALGTLGYDFGNEAKRDSFKQLMAPTVANGVAAPANPHDTRQMVAHLEQHPSEAQSLIWTLNMELTPLYAIEATGPFAAEVLGTLRSFLAGEILANEDEDYIERVSVPGRRTGRSVRLFSGQVVPVIELDTTRGLYGWKTNWLVKTAIEHVQAVKGESADPGATLTSLVGFLNKVYFDMRNLGVLSRDRALNFAATNAFQAAVAFADVLTAGMQLDSIEVEASPYARADADAWDIKLKFFDPENLRRAKIVYRFTVDVSEIMPVTLGEVRSWPTSV